MVGRGAKSKCLKSVGLNTVEYDCSSNCRLAAHGSAITSALTKCSMCDEKLIAYAVKLCRNFAHIVDECGRSAIHMAASVGRYAIIEWLINQGSLINAEDSESGCTALHRAIFYGHIDCAVLLLRYGASLNILDKDFRLPLQHICLVSRLCNKTLPRARNELLVWGTNKNYNLGVSNDRNYQETPQILTYFHKAQIAITQVAMGTFHSLYLDEKGHVYTLGHGKGGRLGIGSENSLTTPKRVKLKLKTMGDTVIDISVSRNHSMVLTMHSLVFVCGLNQSMQLGLKDTAEKSNNFKEIVFFRESGVRNLMKVIARDYHSLTYNKSSVYVWGANVGQMSVNANIELIAAPEKMNLPEQTNISCVEASNTSTAILTTDNTILLFYKYKMKTIRIPNYEPIRSCALIDGDLTRSKMNTANALKMLIVTKTNAMYIWHQKDASFYRCIFLHYRLTQIDKVLYKANQMLILSQEDVYEGRCSQIPCCYNNSDENNGNDLISTWCRKDGHSIDVNKNYVMCIDLKYLNAIDRAVDIFCDNDFLSFAVLQDSPMKYFNLPTFHPDDHSFGKLYENASLDDIVHDLVFQIDGEKFPVHKFVIFSRAPGLAAKLISHNSDKFINVNLTNLTAAMFKVILKFLYNGWLPNEQDLNEVQQDLNRYEICKNRKEIIQLFITAIETLGMHYLSAHLKAIENASCPSTKTIKHVFKSPSYGILPELYDLRLICENNVEIAAHKCVLVARVEYFQIMFSNAWWERDKVNMTTIPYEYMLAVLKYIYDGSESNFRKEQYRKSFLYNLIVLCDQLFINGLRNLCEILLLEKISIKESGEMLDFACLYNCDVLKLGCLDFICQNLSRVLKQRSLENCSSTTLKYINHHYRKLFSHVFDYRLITPYATAIDDDALLQFVGNFQVNINSRMDKHKQETDENLKQKSKTKFSKQSTSYYEREAISTMKESILLAKQTAKVQLSPESSVNQNQDISFHLEDDNVNNKWTKVSNKKQHTKTTSPLQIENITKNEDKLSSMHLNDNEKKCPNETDTVHTKRKLYNLNLSDLMLLQYEKLSQKPSAAPSRSSCTRNSIKPKELANVTEVKSSPAWSSFHQAANRNENTGDLMNPATLDKIVSKAAKSPKACDISSDSIAALNSNISFHDILKEEKCQREDFQRVRNKPLHFTQLEDMAIAELKQFYNIDNVADEVITVHRKPLQSNSATLYNFPVWQQNTSQSN